MNETYNIQAIVLKRQSFKERDDRIVIYSGVTGKKELIVRGTKKILSKLSGHIEPLSLVSLMVVRGKQYDYAGTVISQDVFQNLKNDYERIIIAGHRIMIFDEFVKLDLPDEELFSLLKEFLLVLNSKGNIDAQLLGDIFVFKFFQELGLLPDFAEGVYSGMKLSGEALDFLNIVRGVNLEKFISKNIDPDLKKEINELCDYFLEIMRGL